MTNVLTPMQAALSNKCPRCGQGALTVGYLEPVEKCPDCGADFSRHGAGDGAVFIVLTLLCFLMMGLMFALEMTLQPPVWVHTVAALTLVLGATLILLPPMKRFMIAKSFTLDARGDGEVGDSR